MQPLYDNREAGRSTFFQGSIIALDDTDTLNLGLGQRWILNDGKVIAGLNFFYDNEWDAGHERMSVGGEILTSVGDFRVNSYTALSDTETVNGANETALDGMDMELEAGSTSFDNDTIQDTDFVSLSFNLAHLRLPPMSSFAYRRHYTRPPLWHYCGKACS